jgi:hypothetical protein
MKFRQVCFVCFALGVLATLAAGPDIPKGGIEKSLGPPSLFIHQ